jgi:GNAT superfamily N-acetyltransferase
MISEVKSVSDLIEVWPSVAKSARLVGDDPEVLLSQLLYAHTHGAVFILRWNEEVKGYGSVFIVNNVAHLGSLPNDQGLGLGRIMLEHVRAWAKRHRAVTLEVSTNKMNGSSCKYFTGLGFRRKTLTFHMEV